MTITPDVTVVITCFNLEQYIEECIVSVLEQDYSGQIKILVGDDSSSDESVAIIRKLVHEYNNIELISRAHNIGTANNVIDLYQRVTDDYIVHLDGDDVMLPQRVKATMSFLNANKEIDIVACELSRFHDESGSFCGYHYQEHYQKEHFQHGFTLETLVEHGSFILPSSITFKRKLIENIAIIKQVVVIDDYIRHLQLMMLAKQGQVLFTPYTKYRVRSSGSTGRMQTNLARRYQSLNDMVHARKELRNTEVNSGIIARGIAGEYFSAALFFLRLGKYQDYRQIIEKSVNETGDFYSVKHKFYYSLRFFPRLCHLIFNYS